MGTPLTNIAGLYINTIVIAGGILGKTINNGIDFISDSSKDTVSTGPNTTYQQQSKDSRQSGVGSNAPIGNPALSEESSISISVSGSPSPGGNNGKKDGKNGKKSDSLSNNRSSRTFENDKETILRESKDFTKTGRRYNGAEIYKNSKDGNYYYRDTLHKNELEVFGKNYNHIGTADPVTGKIDYSSAVNGRSIGKIMK